MGGFLNQIIDSILRLALLQLQPVCLMQTFFVKCPTHFQAFGAAEKFKSIN